MPKSTLSSFMLAIPLAALLVGASASGAEDAADSKANPRSPYPAGTPPVTDGYTDTSHGGTKTSGDAPIPPPSKDGKVVILQGSPEPESPAAPASTK